ncbi:MerR family transcriptional regulator [Aliikangiella maris]|uniref:MerR family transcriptional regulator n=2 Tax=Aliikangiella maris TaxID=3162458 RepID=A0ABV3MR04_9GAMM
MFTINQVAKKYQLSRSALIYYDKIGLLQPSARFQANYQLYSQQDLKKMDKIMSYRSAGLSLSNIAKLLKSQNTQATQILDNQLVQLNQQISQLREQQTLLMRLMQHDCFNAKSRIMTKQQWVNILKATGLDKADMRRWHIQFEKDKPEAHTDFLQSPGIDAAEIEQIKSWAQDG